MTRVFIIPNKNEKRNDKNCVFLTSHPLNIETTLIYTYSAQKKCISVTSDPCLSMRNKLTTIWSLKVSVWSEQLSMK